MKKIYDALDLGDFEPVREPMEAYLASVRDYASNQFMLTVEEEEAISKRWASVIERYGYANRGSKFSRELW